MSDTPATLARLLRDRRPKVANRGYPDPIRRRVGAWARAQRTRGASWASLARELPVATTTLIAWAKLASPEGLVPVVVHDEAPAVTAPDTPVLVSPSGYRVEGLGLTALAQLLGHL